MCVGRPIKFPRIGSDTGFNAAHAHHRMIIKFGAQIQGQIGSLVFSLGDTSP